MNALELVYTGIPVSQLASRQDLYTWRDTIRRIAKENWAEDREPRQGKIIIQITYFYENNAAETGDIIKPLLDALIGLVYYNYKQITKVDFNKHDLYGSFKITHLTPTLLEALLLGREFLYLKITELYPPTKESGASTSSIVAHGGLQPEEIADHGPPDLSSPQYQRTSPNTIPEEIQSLPIAPSPNLPGSENIPPFLKEKRLGSSKSSDHQTSSPHPGKRQENDWWEEPPRGKDRVP
jgi:hypothetical protein